MQDYCDFVNRVKRLSKVSHEVTVLGEGYPVFGIE